MDRKLQILIFFLLTVATAHAQLRIITAGSVITETVCALGDCDKIIASDRTSLFPAHIQQLPSIGYRSAIKAEGIISLKPTLIIAEKDYVNDAVLQQLDQSGIKLVIVNRKLNFEDTKKFIAQIGAALGREQEARKLIAKNEAELAEANGWLKRATTTPRVLGIYNHGTATISAAGKDSFAEILNYVGAANAVQNIDRYKPLNAESVIAANPEYLLMLSTGVEGIGGIEGVLKIPGVLQTVAGAKKQILAIESMKLTNFGPRFGETVKELVLLLHPELRAK